MLYHFTAAAAVQKATMDSAPAGLFGAGRQKAATASQGPAAEPQSCEPQHAAAEAESDSAAGSGAAAGPLVQLRGSVQCLQVEAGLAPLRPMQSIPAHVGHHSRPQWPADHEAAQKALQRLGDLRREAASLLPKVSDQMHCCDPVLLSRGCFGLLDQGTSSHYS